MKNILKKLEKNKKRILLVAAIIALVALLLPNLAAAQDPPATSGDLEQLYNQIVRFLIYLMQVLQRVIWPVILLVGGLLKNDILFSSGMEETMLLIWGNVRNIVNILFVIVLLGIAFYNVVGGSSQDYSIKTILPKFVIALVAVNFSFLAIKVVLDGINVVTTAIFALPGAVEKDLPENKDDLSRAVCEGIYGKGDEYTKNLENAKKAEDAGGSPRLCTTDKKFSEKGKEFFTHFDSANAAIVMSINLAQLNLLDTVNVSQPSLKDLAINTMFSAILYVIYGVSFVALLVILLARMVVLWIAMVLSPLIALAFVLPESLRSQMGGGGDLKTKFVQNAIVPIPIALVMSIGFIMLQTLKEAKFDNLTLGTSSLGVGMLTSGLSTLQELIVAVGVIAFIWVGVFESAKNTAAEGIVGTIRDATQGFGKFLATAPFKYAPIIPVKTDSGVEKVSMGAALGAVRRFPEEYEKKQMEEEQRILTGFGAGTSAAVMDELKKATTGKRVGELVVTQSQGYRPWEGTPGKQFQQELGSKLRTLRGREEADVKVEFSQESGYNWQKFKTDLAKGTVPAAVMEEYAKKLREQKRYTPQQMPKPADKPGGEPAKKDTGEAETGGDRKVTGPQAAAAAAAAAPMSVAAADLLTESQSFGARKGVLSSDQRAALAGYEGASPADREAALQKKGEKGKPSPAEALEEVRQVTEESQQFETDLIGAGITEDEQDRGKRIRETIQKRKTSIRLRIKRNYEASGETIADDALEREVNKVVQDEIDNSQARGLGGIRAEEVQEPGAAQ